MENVALVVRAGPNDEPTMWRRIQNKKIKTKDGTLTFFNIMV